MFKQYQRADGFQCLAIQFEVPAEADPKKAFEIISILNDAELNAVHVREEVTDEWYLDEDDNPQPKIIGEHIKTLISSDQLFIGDYVVVRDGETYIMDCDLFDAVWEESITDDPDDWMWRPEENRFLMYTRGVWRHKHDLDVMSYDGGVSYFRLSERPPQRPYGPLYQSVPKIKVGK